MANFNAYGTMITGDYMQKFLQLLENMSIHLTEHQQTQFETYYELLVEWNAKMNLTAITQREEVYEKHFFDSLSVAFILDNKDSTLLDVGSGAGFPSIPLKIVYPELKVTIVDATLKRTLFLNHLVKALELSDVDIHHQRIEDFPFKEQYQWVTARAVAALPTLMEWCVPFVKPNGHFIAMKGPKADEEIESAKKAIKVLGVELLKVHTYTVAESYRALLVFSKVATSPKEYPRSMAKMKKNPL